MKVGSIPSQKVTTCMPMCIFDLKSLGKLIIDTHPDQKDLPEKLNASAPSQQYCKPNNLLFLLGSISCSNNFHVVPGREAREKRERESGAGGEKNIG